MLFFLLYILNKKYEKNVKMIVFDFLNIIYTINEKVNMEKSKKQLCISLDRKLFDLIEKKFNNRSKYIEWLIYQDMIKNSNDEKIKKILI